MKKIFIASLLILTCMKAHALTGPFVQITTSTLQPGTTRGFYVSSGTIINSNFVVGRTTGSFILDGATVSWNQAISSGTRVDRTTTTYNGFNNYAGSSTFYVGYIYNATINQSTFSTLVSTTQITMKSPTGNQQPIFVIRDSAGSLQWTGQYSDADGSLKLLPATASNPYRVGSVFETNATSTTISSTAHIKGTTTNDNALVTEYGAYASTYAVATISVNNTYVNIASTQIAAGDWDCTGVSNVEAGATITRYLEAVSLFSGNTTTDQSNADNVLDGDINGSVGGNLGNVTIAAWRVSINTPTTVYLKGRVSFSVGTPLMDGRLSCRKVR